MRQASVLARLALQRQAAAGASTQGSAAVAAAAATAAGPCTSQGQRKRGGTRDAALHSVGGHPTALTSSSSGSSSSSSSSSSDGVSAPLSWQRALSGAGASTSARSAGAIAPHRRGLHTATPQPGLAARPAAAAGLAAAAGPSSLAAAAAAGTAAAAAFAAGGGRRGITLLPVDAAPSPLPRYRRLRGADDPSKWKRMVIRIPPQVNVVFDEDANALVLTGRSGSTRVKLSHMDPTGLVGMQFYTADAAAGGGGSGSDAAGAGTLLLCVSPSKRFFRGIATHVEHAVHGVMQGYLVGVTVQGVGYRLEPADSSPAIRTAPGAPPSSRRLLWEKGGEKVSVTYPHKQPSKVVRLKVGYTNNAIYRLPEGVVAFFVKPTLVYLYGVDKALVTGAAAALRAVQPPNAYTGNGVLLLGETPKLRQRAGSK